MMLRTHTVYCMTPVNPTALRVDELMAALKKKDDDMRAMEERYKMYLEKARNVSRRLE